MFLTQSLKVGLQAHHSFRLSLEQNKRSRFQVRNLPQGVHHAEAEH